MDYILCNISIIGGSVDEQGADKALKEIPYSSKIKTSYGNGRFKYEYSYVLLPVKEAQPSIYQHILENAIPNQKLSDAEYTAIGNILADYLKRNKDPKLIIDVVTRLTQDDFDILYTDGSCTKSSTDAAYACCKLNREISEEQIPLLENFTGRYYAYEAYAGKADGSSGTNNVGELTAFGVAADHFGEKSYQIIIADSEYSIKAFREWYYNWKNNNFRTYAGKPVKNENLVKDVHNKLFSKRKIVLFKWTAGHAGEPFNEKCDELAKAVLNIKK